MPYASDVKPKTRRQKWKEARELYWGLCLLPVAIPTVLIMSTMASRAERKKQKLDREINEL